MGFYIGNERFCSNEVVIIEKEGSSNKGSSITTTSERDLFYAFGCNGEDMTLYVLYSDILDGIKNNYNGSYIEVKGYTSPNTDSFYFMGSIDVGIDYTSGNKDYYFVSNESYFDIIPRFYIDSGILAIDYISVYDEETGDYLYDDYLSNLVYMKNGIVSVVFQNMVLYAKLDNPDVLYIDSQCTTECNSDYITVSYTSKEAYFNSSAYNYTVDIGNSNTYDIVFNDNLEPVWWDGCVIGPSQTLSSYGFYYSGVYNYGNEKVGYLSGEFIINSPEPCKLGAGALCGEFSSNRAVLVSNEGAIIKTEIPRYTKIEMNNIVSVHTTSLNSICENNKYIEIFSMPDLKDAPERSFDSSFYAAASLKEFNVDSLESIGAYAFIGAFHMCISLETVRFPKLTNIGNNCFMGTFHGCKKLKHLYFNSLNQNSFSNYQNQFENMLGLGTYGAIDGCTVHFPANLESISDRIIGMSNGFRGKNTIILFDLPATE